VFSSFLLSILALRRTDEPSAAVVVSDGEAAATSPADPDRTAVSVYPGK
jgi:hypothetical protein